MSNPVNTKRIYPKVELLRSADGKSRMTLHEMSEILFEVQEELQIRGFDEPAQLIHRVCNKIAGTMMREDVAKHLESKKKDEAA
jgi:hypothetical protein